MFFVFLLISQQNKNHKLKEGPDADQSITGSVFTFSPTDIISETNVFSLVEITDESGNFQTYSLTQEISNIIIKKYEEITPEPEIQGTPTRSPTPEIPFYFSPPILVGVTFAIVFVVGLFYSICCIQTVYVMKTKDQQEGIFKLSELASRANHEQKKLKRQAQSQERSSASNSSEEEYTNSAPQTNESTQSTKRTRKSNHRKTKTKPTPPPTENPSSTAGATSRRRRTKSKRKEKRQSSEETE